MNYNLHTPDLASITKRFPTSPLAAALIASSSLSEEQIEELESEENDSPEIFQYFIVSSNAVDILAYNNEIVFYCEALDMYIWGVTHWGTSWDYVLTDIPLNCGEEAYASYKA